MKRLLTITLIALTFSALPTYAEVALGAQAPDFTLTDINGAQHTLSDYRGKLVILEWVSHGCPFVKNQYATDNMQSLQRDATGKGIIWLSICSSAEGKQGYLTAEEWPRVNAEKRSAATAVLLDEDGTVGHLYHAKTTPHMYIINEDGTLLYQGGIDSIPSTRPEDLARAKNYVRAALDDIEAGRPVQIPEARPYGCAVRYR
ncbi:MAG: redoxin domain-containing protein [Kiritimatiellae bacterium]|nr:redoxin domain-containing protein [Kiritimatiellia bacterium]